ncbi:hypothetical protein Tsubulata_045199 [Turnera subulata]|uniref:rRNA N-glycosylase n=1 Tax=Turnera subulata TaxID=218843 RepID=A0A9Q0FXY4_9ROSI|nr:hypothetical protein Tsubulata_045199 [Turnera subulata]
MKLCRVQVAAVLVGAWICLTLVVGSGAVRVGPSRVEEEGEEYPHDLYPAEKISSTFKTVEFYFDQATSTKEYKAKLINVMRNQLKSTVSFFGIPSLPTKKVTGVDRFGLVTLNYSSEAAVSLVIDVNNLYLVGFYSNNPKANPQKAYYYFTGDAGYRDAVQLFDTDTKVESLGYGEDYGSLGDRSKVDLGRVPLISAVEELYYRKNRGVWKSKLIVLIQMVSEFVRSDLVMNRVLEKFEHRMPAHNDVQFVENNWTKNSKAVRSVTSSSQYFATPIELPSGTVIKNVRGGR